MGLLNQTLAAKKSPHSVAPGMTLGRLYPSWRHFNWGSPHLSRSYRNHQCYCSANENPNHDIPPSESTKSAQLDEGGPLPERRLRAAKGSEARQVRAPFPAATHTEAADQSSSASLGERLSPISTDRWDWYAAWQAPKRLNTSSMLLFERASL
jgi:hypothetical protein